MSIAALNLTSGGSTTDGLSYNTASVSPGANRLILVSVFMRKYGGGTFAPTVTGNGLTYVEVGSTTVPNMTGKIYLFRAMGASPTTGAINITDSGTGNCADITWCVDEFDGVDTSGTDGSGAIVQAVSATSATASSGFTITLAALGDATNNATYSAIGNNKFSSTTPGSGYTELSDAVTGDIGQQSQWKLPGTTTPNITVVSSFASAGGTAVELKAAGGETITVDKWFRNVQTPMRSRNEVVNY